jgi:hypothetical protein
MELEQEELQAPVFSTLWEGFYFIPVSCVLSEWHTSKRNFPDSAVSTKGTLTWSQACKSRSRNQYFLSTNSNYGLEFVIASIITVTKLQTKKSRVRIPAGIRDFYFSEENMSATDPRRLLLKG